MKEESGIGRFIFLLIGFVVLGGLLLFALYCILLYFAWDVKPVAYGMVILFVLAVVEALAKMTLARDPHWVEFTNIGQRSHPSDNRYEVIRVYCWGSSIIGASNNARDICKKSPMTWSYELDRNFSAKETLLITYAIRWLLRKRINVKVAT